MNEFKKMGGELRTITDVLEKKRQDLLAACEKAKDQIPDNPEARRRLAKIKKELGG